MADFKVHIGDMYYLLMVGDYVATISMVSRRLDALSFAEHLAFYEDSDCFTRLARAGLAAYLDCETVWQYGHTGPRMTDLDNYVKISSRLDFLERNYGRDTEFLARHRDEYARRLADQYRLRARWLLCRGRTSEARADLRKAGTGPMADRMLAHMPGFLALGILGLRRGVRRLMGKTASQE